MNFLWLLALALPCTVLAVPQNHTIDDTSPLVDYYQGLHCSPCPDEFKNYGLDPAQLNNGTFSAFENNENNENSGGASNSVETQDNGLTLRFTGTAIYVYLAVPAAANLSNPILCSFILDSIPDLGGDFLMNPPEINQYNVLAYAKTDIPDDSHILNMDVGDTPVVFDYANYTSDTSEPNSSEISASAMTSSPAILPSSSTSSPAILPSSSTSAAMMTSAAATTSSATILTSSSSKKTLSIPLIAGAVAVGVALILALFAGFVLYHRARRTKAYALDMEEWGSMPSLTIPRGAGDGLVGNGNIQDHRGTASAAQMQQNQGGNEVPLPQLRNEVERLEVTSNGTGSDIAPLVSTSMEGSSAEGSNSASRARSLSMMKRDQTRALQDHEHCVGVSDTLVHMDSGLRLTVGRVVDEVPPSYVVD